MMLAFIRRGLRTTLGPARVVPRGNPRGGVLFENGALLTENNVPVTES